MPSVSVEDYLKALLKHEQAAPGTPMGNGALAQALDVAPPSVTGMMQTLAEAGLVRHIPRRGAELTPAGRKLALQVQRRHRIIELFLVHHLHMPVEEVHDEAERLEHAVSDKVLERLDALLGHPVADPHGEPIPQAAKRPPVPLSEAPRRTPLRLAAWPGAAALRRRLADHGLQVGAPCAVESVDGAAETLTLRSRAGDLTLSLGAAAQVLVHAD